MLEALLLVASFAFACAIVVYVIKYFMKKRLKQHAEEEAERQRQLEATRKWREGLNAKWKTEQSSVPPRGLETTKSYTPTKQTFAPSPTQSVQSHDDSSNLLANILIMDALTRHHNEPTIKSERYDPGVTYDARAESAKDTSSWGFDDSDSRKSISSSMDTSSSWSSSSSDSFSSSDSGPSSDW
jgi:hypothetical protein